MSGLKPQHLAIGAVGLLVAFGAAFGVGKATGGSDSKSSSTSKSGGGVEKADPAKGGLDVASLDTGSLPGIKKKKSSSNSSGSNPSGPHSTNSTHGPTTRGPHTGP